jgi:hypothetical protein
VYRLGRAVDEEGGEKSARAASEGASGKRIMLQSWVPYEGPSEFARHFLWRFEPISGRQVDSESATLRPRV